MSRESEAEGRDVDAGRDAKKPDAKNAPPGSSSVGAKVSTSIGIIAAMVLAVVANVLVARHYKRWDVTRGGLYTLSDPTLQTLHGLEEPVSVFVMLPAGDPLTTSVSHLLEAYKAETTRLDVKLTDPDRHRAEFLAIQKKYGVVEGKTEDGRILTDAAIIVAKGDKPYFLTANDLVAVEDEEDMRTRPRLEEALTTAIRSVTTGARPKICFATGHGEKPLDNGGDAGLAALKDRLGKNNYDTLEIAPARAGAKEDLPGCDLLVIAGPSEPVPADDTARYVAFVKNGGSLLLAVGPVPDPDDAKYVDLGLGNLFAAVGLEMQTDFVFELDSKRKSPNGFGETFMPEAKPHAITDGLLRAADRGIGVTLTITSSISKVPGEAATSPLLVTTDRSFGMVDFFAWAKNPTPPSAKPEDHKGPLTVAWAVEMPKPANAAHGGRAVVVGSWGPLVSSNWQSEELRGTAAFVESSISWLVSRPSLVSVPKKPSVTAGLRVSEEDITRLGLYTVLCMPLASALFGVAVFLRRRSSERRGKKALEGAEKADAEKAAAEKANQKKPSAAEGKAKRAAAEADERDPDARAEGAGDALDETKGQGGKHETSEKAAMVTPRKAKPKGGGSKKKGEGSA